MNAHLLKDLFIGIFLQPYINVYPNYLKHFPIVLPFKLSFALCKIFIFSLLLPPFAHSPQGGKNPKVLRLLIIIKDDLTSAFPP